MIKLEITDYLCSRFPFRKILNFLCGLQASETAAQVGTVSSSDRLLSYSATASQCEAFGAGTHKKLSDVLKLDSKATTPLAITLPNQRDPGRIMNGEETIEGKVKCSSSLAK